MANVGQYIGARYVTKIYENSLDPSSAEWEASTAYEPLTMVTYNNSSYLSKKEVPNTVGDPSSNPEYWIVTGAYNGQIAYLQDQIDELKTGFVTPEMFGAAGDGLANDTAAVQSAFSSSVDTVILNGNYRIEDTLFVTGKKNIIGSGSILAYLPGVDPNEYIIAFGASSLGVAGEVFEGLVEGIAIIGKSGNINYGLSFTNAQNVTVRGITMDFTDANCHNKFIFFGRNVNVAPDNSNKENYIVEGSLFISDPVPGSGNNACETISFADGHSHITIKDNIILYCKDDAVGLHLCTDIKVLNNYIYSYSGRILGTWIQNCIVDGNTIEVEPNIQCQGIQFAYELGGNSTVNDNIRVVNNVVDYTGTTSADVQYGIRMQGVKNSLISGNRLKTGNGYQARLALENQPVTAYTPTFIFSENNEICNNDVTDIFVAILTASPLDQHLPNVFHDNIIHRIYSKSGIYNYSRNNTVVSDLRTFDANTLEYSFSESKRVPDINFTYHGTLSNAAQAMLCNGYPTYRFSSDAKLEPAFIFRLFTQIALTGANYYTIKLYKNTSLIATINKQNESIDYTSIAAADRVMNEGDYIYATIQITGTVPSPAPDYVQIGLFEEYLNNC